MTNGGFDAELSTSNIYKKNMSKLHVYVTGGGDILTGSYVIRY